MPMQRLFLLDPELARELSGRLIEIRPDDPRIPLLVEETLWGFSTEINLGYAFARGLADLIAGSPPDRIFEYRNRVHQAAETGPALGRTVALHLAPVLRVGGNDLPERFQSALETIREKGAYILPAALSPLSALIDSGGPPAAGAYLDLLAALFSQELSYEKRMHFARILPDAALSFPPSRRVDFLEQLQRIARAGSDLVEPFIEGIEKDLKLLSRDTLARFAALGIERRGRDPEAAKKFVSLVSHAGIEAFLGLQVAVPLSRVEHRIVRHLRARTGLPISVGPLSLIPDPPFQDREGRIGVQTDGKCIYLPEEIGCFPRKDDNLALYQALAGLEAGVCELGTHGFDLEKLSDRLKGFPSWFSPSGSDENGSDLERLFGSFPEPTLAADLFTVYEHGRIRLLLSRKYPGMARKTFPLIEKEAERIHSEAPSHPLFPLYLDIAAGCGRERSGSGERHFERCRSLFVERIADDPSVETSGELLVRTYRAVEAVASGSMPMPIPFGRRLRPDLAFKAFRALEEEVLDIRNRLAKKGIHAYRSEIRNHLRAAPGRLTRDRMKPLLSPGASRGAKHAAEAASSTRSGPDQNPLDSPADPVFWHREWDSRLSDYLKDHVRLTERRPAGTPEDFRPEAAAGWSGLIRSIRRELELLKSEGLAFLRQWTEGEEFDYRALLDFAVDRKMGRIPSDRLYLKRVKSRRDVSVLLLADLSRSTANRIHGSDETVLDLERKSIILFCEALEAVGDAYAVAGFSGSGRLGVSYYRIKDFEEPLGPAVRARVNAIRPQRSTRTGAAIRHALRELEYRTSPVRLLILLSDGFPNDLGYRQNYAVEDTRMAIAEGRSKNIHVHAITVDLAGGEEEIFGRLRYNRITDIRDLPGRLLHAYRDLTRR